MEFLTNEKLTTVGAAGITDSNMARTTLIMKSTPNICLYDPYAPTLEDVAEELHHYAFEGVNLTYISDTKEALSGAKYIVSSGGATRKAGMTREDLLKGNAETVAQFDKDIHQYCPDVEHVVVVSDPVDITGLIVLLYAGLKPSQVSTLVALDNTRLQNEPVKHLHIPASEIVNCRTYGGHGEQMAVLVSTIKAQGEALTKIIDTPHMPMQGWEDLEVRVIRGGKHIINLHGRSSFQSPAYLSIEMIAVAMGGQPFRWLVGTYVSDKKFDHILMAMETSITKGGVSYKGAQGAPEERKEMEESYARLCKLCDEVIATGVPPKINRWHELNKHIN